MNDKHHCFKTTGGGGGQWLGLLTFTVNLYFLHEKPQLLLF